MGKVFSNGRTQTVGRQVVRERFIETVRQIQAGGKAVILVAPPPRPGFNVGACWEQVGLGLAMLGSITLASFNVQRAGTGAGVWHPWMVKQAAACGIGFVGLIVAASIDYRRLERWVWPIYAVTLVLLALVLTPLGVSAKGAQRWIFGIQPSEFAKVALILSLAWFATRFAYRLRTFTTGILGMGGIAFPLLVLVVVEPDKGTTLLLAFVTVALMLVAGVRWLYVLVPVVAGGAAFVVLVATSDYAHARVRAFLNPGGNPTLNYQGARALGAVGVGGTHLHRAGSARYHRVDVGVVDAQLADLRTGVGGAPVQAPVRAQSEQ